MIDLDELLTLRPEDDIPDDARLSVTAAELRAFCDAVVELKFMQTCALEAQFDDGCDC